MLYYIHNVSVPLMPVMVLGVFHVLELLKL
nr:MAG TPA: hypothetical protein [Crassvirales sp.]